MLTKKVLIQYLILIAQCISCQLTEDGKLNFMQLATKYGHKPVQYIVNTEDGYILKLFRIPGKRKIPTLLMHGIADTADTWLVRGNASLAVTLANRGEDVWAGNARGNKYGRNNIFLNPDTDNEFWKFSFHHIGLYDLPAIIDTVLNVTRSRRINVIGHSQGNAVFYVLLSSRPEYNAKVNSLTALAPICFLQNLQPPLSNIIKISPLLNELYQKLNIHELFRQDSLFINTWQFVCSRPLIGDLLCLNGILFPITGYDNDELEPSIVPTVFGRFPNGISVMDLYHFAQVSMRREFAQYDYGKEKNLVIYNSEQPPVYNLSAITTSVYLFVGANDKLATLEDVEILRKRLSNVQYLLIPRRQMNHADFVWGRHMYEYLFPYIFKVLEANMF